METGSIVKASSSLSLMNNQWIMVMIGVLTLCFVAFMYIAHRYLKSINQRFEKLEEIIGKIIERNNQIQNTIHQRPQVVAAPSQPQPIFIPVQPSVNHQPPAVVNLDKEIENELKELVQEEKVIVEKEGRIDSTITTDTTEIAAQS